MCSASVGEPGSRTWATTLITGRARPARADGAELIGEFESSGYREPPALIRRADGQVVHLHPLLFEVAKQLDGRQPLPYLASAIARETGVEMTADQVGYLVDHKLAPLGISTYCDGSPPAVATANPFLRLRFRIGVLPERATSFIGGLFAWLHHPAMVFLGVLAAVIGEGWLFTFQNVPLAAGQVLTMPAGMLLVFGLAVASTAFHEVGHASACRYCGIRPGKMGCGLYLVWPVFYTDINDSYRLGRGGRLRTDLGGIYFNGLFIAALTAGYWLTGFAPLAVAVVAIDFEIVQQLLPAVRFDAYYIVSDLIGVPDLFRYIGPMVKRVLLRAPGDQLKALKRWPKVIIGIWVFGVVPVGLAELGMLIWHLPPLVATGRQTAVTLLHAGQVAAGNGNLIGLASAALQMVFAIIPLAGITLLVLRALIGAVRFAGRRLRREGAVAAAASAHATRGLAARGRHAPRRATRGTTSRGRHAAGPCRAPRQVNSRGRHSMTGTSPG
jgi:putative peptide zinc metalloprotease protein